VLLNEDIDWPAVDNDQRSFVLGLLSIANRDLLFRLVNNTNKFEGDFVLEIDAEMSQEENWFFNYSHVCLQNEFLL